MMVKESRETLRDEVEGCRVAQPETASPQSGREMLYSQHFFTQVSHVTPPAGFIEQVNGYGVQVFSQASSFTAR